MDGDIVSSPRVQDDIERLIRLVTPTKACNQEQKRYTSNQLASHRYLDVNSHAVRETLKGMVTRFINTGLSRRGERLQELSNKFTSLPEFKHSTQTELAWRMLHLLLNLCHNPTRVGVKDYCRIELAAKGDKKVEEINWKELLSEDNFVWTPSDNNSESDWSDEDVDAACDHDDLIQEQRGGTCDSVVKYSLPLSEPLPSGKPEREGKANLECAIQSPYWRSGNQEGFRTSAVAESTTSNFARTVEQAIASSGKPVIKSKIIGEYQVIREVLWMFMVPHNSFLFSIRGGSVAPVEGMTVCSLSPKCFQSYMSEYCKHFTRLKTLKDFVESVTSSEDKLPPSTYEAYCGSLNQFFQQWNTKLSELENEVRQQDKTMTLIMISHQLEPMLNQIKTIHSVHMRAVLDWTKNPYCLCAMRLLSVLHVAVMECYFLPEGKFFLQAFLQSVQPYVHIMDVILNNGHVEDFRDEFLLVRNPKVKVKDVDFWESSYQTRLYQEQLESEGLYPPTFLRKLLPYVIECGKSNELLLQLEGTRWGINPDSSLHRDILKDFPELVVTPSKKPACDLPKPVDGDILMKHINYINDPHLISEYMTFIRPKQEEEKNAEVVTCSPSDVAHPLWRRIETAFNERVKDMHVATSLKLEEQLKKKFHMHEHLDMIWNVYFFQAGDAMHQFCTHLSEMIASGDEWRHNLSLSSLLEHSISTRCGDFTPRFCIDITEYLTLNDSFKQLEFLNISYRVPWPLTQLITKSNIATYNFIFRIVMKIHYVICNLEKLNFKDLMVQQGDAYTVTSWVHPQKLCEELSEEHLKHRCHLLRSWFLHFLGSVQAHCLGKVIPEAILKLHARLAQVHNFDAMIKAHKTFLQIICRGCFDMFPEVLAALDDVLQLSLTFSTMWQNGTISTFILCDMEDSYSRSHKRIASILHRLMMNDDWDYDGLAAALVYSCPSKED